MVAVLEEKMNVFFWAAVAAQKAFPASVAQQRKPIYERFSLDLCPKKRKTY